MFMLAHDFPSNEDINSYFLSFFCLTILEPMIKFLSVSTSKSNLLLLLKLYVFFFFVIYFIPLYSCFYFIIFISSICMQYFWSFSKFFFAYFQNVAPTPKTKTKKNKKMTKTSMEEKQKKKLSSRTEHNGQRKRRF